MRRQDEYLFMRGDLDPTLDNIRTKAMAEIEAMEPNRLLQISETDLIEYIKAEYAVEPVKLLRDEMYVTEPQEVEIDVSNHPRRAAIPGRRAVVKGVTFSVVVPFTGSGIVLHCRPQRYTLSPPRGRVEEQTLYLDFECMDTNADTIRREYERRLDEVEDYLVSGTGQINQHNNRLEREAAEAITRRKKRLLDNQGLVGSLGLPVRRRDVPDTYSIPMEPRKPRVQKPAAPTTPFQPEPALPADEYEHILDILGSMALVMERSPKTFAKLDEEEIRDHFLIHLNGHYEGQATGETFNYEGKTDILIRAEGRTVFIAECLVWRGEAYLTQKIDQILGYTSWRDTKTAILIFSRNKDFSAVLAKVAETVEAHPNCKKAVAQEGETQFRFLFHHREDRNRELTIAVMAFHVPELQKE